MGGVCQVTWSHRTVRHDDKNMMLPLTSKYLLTQATSMYQEFSKWLANGLYPTIETCFHCGTSTNTSRASLEGFLQPLQILIPTIGANSIVNQDAES